MRPARLLLPALLLCGVVTGARADWERTATALAWRRDTATVWKFSFDPQDGKPHFASLTTGGTELAVVRPADHIWHYGLWFSWKFINGVNYWEEDAAHRAEGATRWTPPQIETAPDGAATIRLALTYARPDGRVDLTEERTVRLSAPDADGAYRIDWTAHFVAGAAGAVLDRTPLPGEPGGKVHGGYGGLGLRLPSAPLVMTVLTPAGPVAPFESERARPQAAALACNFSTAGRDLGGVALLAVPPTPGAAGEVPWYVVNGDTMRFACAALLAPKPLALAPGAPLALHYRILVRPSGWTAESLGAAVRAQAD